MSKNKEIYILYVLSYDDWADDCIIAIYDDKKLATQEYNRLRWLEFHKTLKCNLPIYENFNDTALLDILSEKYKIYNPYDLVTAELNKKLP